jgi:hypothetical protein
MARSSLALDFGRRVLLHGAEFNRAIAASESADAQPTDQRPASPSCATHS